MKFKYINNVILRPNTFINVRDLIWTIIVIWIVWKLYHTFKIASASKHQKDNSSNLKDGEVIITKSSGQSSNFDTDDYVDYEEIK